MENKNSRTCYYCENYILCFLRRRLEEVERVGTGSLILTIKTDEGTPGTYVAMYAAMANCCKKYQGAKINE
jgi:hypothetical protein